MKDKPENKVDKYIAECPIETRKELEKMRKALLEAAPGATERTDYFQMPGYSYEGYDYNGMFAWSSFKKPNIRLHVRPPVIQDNAAELKGYKTTEAIVNFPLSQPLPLGLIKKLVKDSIKVMEDKA